uniref:Uncharacterized protein n=1 Tax=Heterorhabditis bacteriophora TaxID=37862 RepID=A0A1I7WK53_HETBA
MKIFLGNSGCYEKDCFRIC